MADEVKTIKGAEIFATGRWNGLPFTQQDLDGIVSAFNALNLAGRIPLKLGHDGPDQREDPTTQFAMGWVKSIYREGDKMLADLEVPAKVQGLIDQGFLRFVSVELLQNVRANSRVIPWVLDGVALLGTDPPAVGILKDLTGMATYQRTTLEFAKSCEFTRAQFTPMERPRMSEQNTETAAALKALSEQVANLTVRASNLEAENADLKKQRAEFKQMETRFDKLKEDTQKEKVDNHRASIVSTLEAAVKAQDILPAARERFMKSYRVAEDQHVMDVSIEDVREFIKENPNTAKPAPRKVRSFMLDNPNDDVPDGTPADQEVSLRVRAMIQKANLKVTPENIVTFTKQLFTANPDLADRYERQFGLENRAKFSRA